MSAHTASDHPDPYAGRATRQWWLVSTLTVLMMIGNVDRQIISLLTNPIKADLGLTDTQMSLIFGLAFAIANTAFTLPAGYLADRMSRRLLVGVGAIVWSAMAICCGLATGYWQLFFARAGVGFGEAVIGPSAMSMMRSALAPERRGKGFSVFNMAGLGGAALALVAGGALIGAITHSGITALPVFGRLAPWQMVLIIIGLVGFPLSLLMLTVREPLHALRAATTDEDAGVGGGFGGAFAYMASRWPVYLPLLLYLTLFGLSSASFGAWVAPMMGRKFGLSIPQIGGTLGIMMLILPALGLAITGILLDRAAKRSGLLGMTVVGLGVTFLYWLTAWTAPLSPSLPMFWVAFACHMLLSGTPGAVGATMLAATTPSRIMGKVAAVQLFIYGFLAIAIGPVVVALFSDNVYAASGNNSLALALSTVTFVYGSAAVVTLLVLRGPLKREASKA